MELLIPIFGIVGVFGMPVFIVWIVHYFESKSEKKFHQTLQELIKSGHLYILQTPIYRVRDKQNTFYCYSEEEKNKIINILIIFLSISIKF